MFDFPGSATAAIVELFFKTTILLVPALLAAALSKRRTAAFRHFLLSFALIGLLFVPLVSLLPFGWRTPILPARPVVADYSAPAARLSKQTAVSFAESGVFVRDEPAVGSRPVLEGPLEALPTPDDVLANGIAVSSIASIYPNASPINPDASTSRNSSSGSKRAILDIGLVSVWIGGLFVLLLRLSLGLAGAARMTREGTGLEDPAWRILLLRFLSIISLRRTVRLKSHPDVLIPMTWGWRRPVILLPSGAGAWAETERSTALFHELSHVKRADFLFLFLVRLSLSLFWWNPLCWVVYVRIRREQEIACDELVLRAGIKPSIYAAGLLAFRRSAGLRWNPSAALPGLIGGSSFQERLAAILKQKKIIKEINMKSRIILAAAVVLAVALIGSARPVAGVEAKAETAPAPAAMTSLSPAHPAVGQEVKVQTTTKEKEKAKAEGKTQVEITIVRDGKETKLVLDEPLTIRSGKDGKVLVLGKDGKEFEVIEDKPWHLELKDGKLLKLDEAEAFTVGKDGGKIIVYEKSAGGKAEPVVIKKTWTDKDGVKVVVEGGAKGEGTAVWTMAEPVKGGVAYTISEKDGKGLTWSQEGGPTVGLTYYSEKDKALLEQVKALREQAAKVKAGALDISELEKSLEKLAAELESKDGKRGYFAVGKTAPSTGTAYFVHGDKLDVGKNVAFISGTTAKEGTIMVVLSGKSGAEGKAAFKRALDKLEKEIPEGYSVAESKYDEESGSITLKIEGPADKKHDVDFIKKLVDVLKDEIKK